MRKVLQTASVVLLSANLFAASPVAKVRSAESFHLRGQAVQVEGVPAWTMVAGDDITTGGSPATIEFTSGARVVLDSNSTAKIESGSSGLAFRLLNGRMRVQPGAATSGVSFFSGSSPVQAAAQQEVTATAGTSIRTGTSTAPRAVPLPKPASRR